MEAERAGGWEVFPVPSPKTSTSPWASRFPRGDVLFRGPILAQHAHEAGTGQFSQPLLAQGIKRVFQEQGHGVSENRLAPPVQPEKPT